MSGSSQSSDETSQLVAVGEALGLELSAKQVEDLSRYLDLFERWNATYNLSAVRTRDAMRVQHVADCLAVVPALMRHRSAGRLLDVGSGGGLPGVVIALLCPGWDVSCVDAVGKKAAFVRQVAATLGLANLHAVHGRVETLQAERFDLITARAFASLSSLARLSQELLSPDGAWMAMKGRLPDDELAELPPAVEVFHVERLSVPGLEAERCLVWMRPRRDS